MASKRKARQEEKVPLSKGKKQAKQVKSLGEERKATLLACQTFLKQSFYPLLQTADVAFGAGFLYLVPECKDLVEDLEGIKLTARIKAPNMWQDLSFELENGFSTEKMVVYNPDDIKDWHMPKATLPPGQEGVLCGMQNFHLFMQDTTEISDPEDPHEELWKRLVPDVKERSAFSEDYDEIISQQIPFLNEHGEPKGEWVKKLSHFVEAFVLLALTQDKDKGQIALQCDLELKFVDQHELVDVLPEIYLYRQLEIKKPITFVVNTASHSLYDLTGKVLSKIVGHRLAAGETEELIYPTAVVTVRFNEVFSNVK